MVISCPVAPGYLVVLDYVFVSGQVVMAAHQ